MSAGVGHRDAHKVLVEALVVDLGTLGHELVAALECGEALLIQLSRLSVACNKRQIAEGKALSLRRNPLHHNHFTFSL